MDNILPKPKQVNHSKLQALTESELEERIKKAPEKVNSKREKYNQQHALNMARLAAYESYKKADAEACKKILSERKAKTNLPAGNQSGKVA